MNQFEDLVAVLEHEEDHQRNDDQIDHDRHQVLCGGQRDLHHLLPELGGLGADRAHDVEDLLLGDDLRVSLRQLQQQRLALGDHHRELPEPVV
jgi:hypothetical protein